MRLHDLPLEILDEIIKGTLPEGIEAFALTCKDVHARAIPHIERHNRLRRQWGDSLITETNALRKLHELIRDPVAAEYVESLSMWDREGLEPPWQEEDVLNDEATAVVRNAVLNSPYLKAAAVDAQVWWENMDTQIDLEAGSGFEPFIHQAIMLLTQLPRLKTLRLFPAWDELNLFADAPVSSKNMLSVLKAIVSKANARDGRGSALAKLETIMPCMAGGYNERFALQSIQPFFGLKNMTELFAISCLAVDDKYTGIPFQWISPDLGSPIRRMELACCCMDAEGVGTLVKHTPRLQVFRYSHQTKWHGCLHDWNPGSFIQAIAENCGETITELALTIDELYGDIENGASSFLAFPRLQRIECDVLIFMGPPVESGQKKGIAGYIEENVKEWTTTDIPCIGSMLPSSIVDVQINTNFPDPDKAALMALLKDIRWQRANRLSNLKRVLIRQEDAGTARDLAEEMEVSLEIFAEPHADRSMVPLWKRKFQERVEGIDQGE